MKGPFQKRKVEGFGVAAEKWKVLFWKRTVEGSGVAEKRGRESQSFSTVTKTDCLGSVSEAFKKKRVKQDYAAETGVKRTYGI